MHRHHAVPLLDGDVLNVVGRSDTGVVDENVDAAQHRDAALDQMRDLIGFATSAWMALLLRPADRTCSAIFSAA